MALLKSLDNFCSWHRHGHLLIFEWMSNFYMLVRKSKSMLKNFFFKWLLFCSYIFLKYIPFRQPKVCILLFSDTPIDNGYLANAGIHWPMIMWVITNYTTAITLSWKWAHNSTSVFLTNLAQTDCVATAFFFFFLLTLILATTGTSKHYSISWCGYWGTAPQTPPAIYKHTAVHKWDFFLVWIVVILPLKHTSFSNCAICKKRKKK